MNKEIGKFIVVDSSNIGAIIDQFIKREKARPAQVMRPCFKCKQVMYNQASYLVLNDGEPEFYCELCPPRLSLFN